MDTKVQILLVHILLLCSTSISTPVEQHSSEEAVQRSSLDQNIFPFGAELKSRQSSSLISTPVAGNVKSKRTLDQNELSLDSIKMAQLLEEVEAIFLRNIGSLEFEKKNNNIISTFRIHWLKYACWLKTIGAFTK